jgi:hypothetical protein
MKILSKEIEMIAHFERNGVIVPHRFRIAGDDDEAHVISVGKVIKSEETSIAGIKAIVYDCQSLIGGIQKLYCLKYRILEHKWELYKIFLCYSREPDLLES